MEVGGVDGRVLVATDRSQDGKVVEGPLTLAPWTGAIIALDG